MEALARRGFLKALLGVGAAAVCGLKATESMAQGATAEVSAAAEAVTEGVEAGLEPNQFIVVRPRRRRRRVILVRPRRRVVIVRRRRWRRW